MNYDYQQTDLSRSVLGGLFTGLIAAVANMAFVIIYKSIVKFKEFYPVDITIIVFGSVLLSIACGIIFYLFIHYFKKGIPFYRICVVAVTVLIAYIGITLRQTVQDTVPMEFRVLVIGTQVIIGGLAVFLIPYLFRHDSIIS